MAKLRIVRSIEWTNNHNISKFLESNSGFSNCQISEICQFLNLENLKNCQYVKFEKIPVWKIKKIFDSEKSKNI